MENPATSNSPLFGSPAPIPSDISSIRENIEAGKLTPQTMEFINAYMDHVEKYALANMKLDIEDYSLQSNAPKIPVPKDMNIASQEAATKVPTLQEVKTAVEYLKGLNSANVNTAHIHKADESGLMFVTTVNLIALLSIIMNEVAQTSSRNRVVQAEVAIKEYGNMASFAATSAKLTLETYKQKTRELLVQSFTQVGSAAISGVGVLQNAQVSANAVNDPRVQEIATKKTAAQNEINALEQQLQTGDMPGEINPNKEVQTKALADKKAELSTLEGQYSTAMTDSLNAQYGQIRLMTELGQSALNAASSMIQIPIKTAEGQAEALKQLVQGYQQSSQQRYDQTKNAADKASSEVSKAFDSLIRFINEFFAATRITKV